MKYAFQETGTLVLALISGLAFHATFTAIFSAIVPFSLFPAISFILSMYCLHQRYRYRTMPAGLPGLFAACFVLGLVLYSAVVRAEYPQMGSNFLPTLLSGILFLFVGSKIRARRKRSSEKS